MIIILGDISKNDVYWFLMGEACYRINNTCFETTKIKGKEEELEVNTGFVKPQIVTFRESIFVSDYIMFKTF